MPPEQFVEQHRPVTLAIIGLLIVCLLGVVLWEHRNSPWLSSFLGTNTNSAPTERLPAITYTCNSGKTITATFTPPSKAKDQGGVEAVPMPDGSVSLILSDGRALTLPQTVSASGIRFANTEETLIFWSKGNTAFLEEGPRRTQTYQNCVTASPAPEGSEYQAPAGEFGAGSDIEM